MALLIAGVAGLGIGYAVYLFTNEEGLTNADTKSVTMPDDGLNKSDQLVDRLILFETAYHSVPQGDTTENLLARISPYTSSAFIEHTPLSRDSGADIALRESGESIEAHVSNVDITIGEPDGPNAAFPHTIVHMKRLDVAGNLVDEYDVESSSYWKYTTAQGWMVYPIE